MAGSHPVVALDKWSAAADGHKSGARDVDYRSSLLSRNSTLVRKIKAERCVLGP